MKTISNLALKHSKMIILIVIILTLVLGYFATQIQIKAGIEDMFPKENETVDRFYRVNDLFGGMNFAIIMLEDENILDKPTLKKIENLTADLEKLAGVEEVVSLTNVKEIRGNPLGIEVGKLIAEFPEDEKTLEKLQNKLINSKQYLGSIISEDFTSTIIQVKFIKKLGNAEKTITELKNLALPYSSPEKMYFSGNPVAVNDANIAMKNDIKKLIPFVIAIVTIILFLSFKSISGVLLPLGTVLISIIWTLGGLALTGRALSMISVALPVLLVSIGSAYAIHVVARYYEELAAGEQVTTALRNATTKVGIAVLIAGTTTMAGFGALVFSGLLIIKEFALSTAFGVGVALLISIFFIPAVYLHLPKPGKKQLNRDSKNRLNILFSKVFSIVSNQGIVIITLVTVLIVICSIAIPGLHPETGYLNYFNNHSETKIAADLVDQRFGGSATLDIVINGDIKNPQLLAKMRDFQDEAEKIPGLNHPISMVTLLEAENKALNGDDPAMEVIPTNRQQIAQYLLLLTMSDQDATKNYLTFDEQTTRIQFLMENMPSKQMQGIIQEVESLIAKHFGDTYPVELTGMPVLTAEISNIIIQSQIQSIIASIVLAFFITSILLKSAKRGLFCSLTIALTVLVNFGVMGWLKIPLDIATTMIASVAVGIGIDYSIHIYTRYLEERAEKSNQIQALKTAIDNVGRANLYNALAVISGFCVLLFSSFPPLVNFGGLTAITMIVSFISAIFLLPTFILLSLKIRQRLKKRAYAPNYE